jgi:hypothetical protein
VRRADSSELHEREHENTRMCGARG